MRAEYGADDHRAVSPNGVASPVSAELVGRERERAVLRGAYERARAGQGGLVLISGEAGIGKTSLVQALLTEVDEHEVIVLTGASYDLRTTPPYGPWNELVRAYHAPPGQPTFPGFMAESKTESGPSSQAALFSRALEFIVEVANHQTLVLVLEDLHWADQSSLDLLRFVARSIRDLRVLLVGTYRGVEITHQDPLYLAIPQLVRESQATRIELRRLAVDEIRTLIQRLYPLDSSDRDGLVEYLGARADGNPLFIHEVLRHLEFQGILQHENGHWFLRSLDGPAVPDLIQQMVEGRLAGFSDGTRSAIRVGSVIGQQVPLKTWEALLDEEVLDTALQEVTRSGLMVEMGDAQSFAFRHALVREAVHSSIPPMQRRVWHRQVADYYLKQVAPDPELLAFHLQQAGDDRAVDWLIHAGERAERRFAWHEAIARYGEAIQSMQQHPDELARIALVKLRIGELLRFVDPARANEYLEAAHDAAIAGDMERVAAHARFGIGQNLCNLGVPQRGLALMRDAINVTDTGALPHATPRYRPPGLIDPAHAQPMDWFKGNFAYWLAAFGGFQDAISIAEETLGEVDWRQATDSQSFARIAEESSAGNRNTYLALGHALALAGRPHEAGLAFDLALEVNRGARFEPHNLLIANQALLGHYIPYRADRPHERDRLVEIITHQWVRTSEGMVTDRFLPGYEYLLLLEGHWDKLRHLIAINPEPTLFPYWSLAMYVRAQLARFAGDRDGAWTYLKRLLPDGPRSEPDGHVHLIPGAPHRVAANLAIDAHDFALARDWMTAHDAWLQWSDAVPGRAHGTLVWSQIRAGEGDAKAARKIAGEALQQASDPEQPLALIAIHRFLGELATADRNCDIAERNLGAAIELADACQAPFERALALLALAELEITRGDKPAARHLLSTVRKTCTELGASPTLQRAEHLTRSLTASSEDGDTYGLSSRELEVLGLIAQGLTDRQIAERLFISHRTVMRHVSHILQKLDVESRTAAAARAVGEDLL